MQNNMVAMLKNPNENVVQSSLEALFFLSNNPENKKALAQTKGLPEGVSALRKSSSHSLRSVADAILNNLQEFLAPALHPSTNTQQRSTIRAEAPVKPANPAPVIEFNVATHCLNHSRGCDTGTANRSQDVLYSSARRAAGGARVSGQADG